MTAKSNPRLKLNPAFQAAHSKGDKKNKNDPWSEVETQLASATNGEEKVTFEIVQARKTGKLQLCGAGLESLPDAIFDIRNDLLDKYTGNLDDESQLKKHEKAWECYGEEMLTMIDLSENNLSNAESLERMDCFKALQSLHLRNCQLRTLPWDVFQNLNSLKVLDAPGNNFVAVPLEKMPESISTLNLANNCIENLGDDLNTILLPNLLKLDLQGNKTIVRLPTKLCTPRLQHAYMSKNSIGTISKHFLQSCKESLRTLDLGENELTTPLNLVQHSELQVLQLRYNKIRDVPSIHQNLVQLTLSHNNISTIKGLYPFLEQCNEFGRTDDGDFFRPNLKELCIGQNNLSELHMQTMAVMTNLSFLDVADNSLETIPSVVGYLKDLNKVVLDGNPFRIIRSAISYRPQGGIDTQKLVRSLRKKDNPPKGPGYHASAGYFEEDSGGNDAGTSQKMMEAKMLVRMATNDKRSLDLNGRGLTGELLWPELIDALSAESDDDILGSRVSIFNISDGKLTSFGMDWVKALPSMSVLDAHRNCLDSLPTNLNQLSLQSILCSRNCLTSHILQDVICIENTPLCSSLIDLDLSMNKLEWIPDGLFDMNALRSLNLSQNNIKSLAWEQDEITGKERGWRHGLVSLEYLNLSDNRISNLGYLPLALFGCKKLHTLFLNNNCLYDIPLEIGLLDQLNKIDLLGNSQRKIGIRVLTQSCSKILKYLSDRMDAEQLAKARENHVEILEALKDEYGVEIGNAIVQEQDKISIHKKDQNTATPATPATPTLPKAQDTLVEHSKDSGSGKEVLNEIKKEIDAITVQLENDLSISQAKRFALKKTLAMQRSKLIREERRLKEESP